MVVVVIVKHLCLSKNRLDVTFFFNCIHSIYKRVHTNRFASFESIAKRKSFEKCNADKLVHSELVKQ